MSTMAQGGDAIVVGVHAWLVVEAKPALSPSLGDPAALWESGRFPGRTALTAGGTRPIVLTEMRASELAEALQREELDAGFSFGVPDDDAIAQQPAWSYAAMALLPPGHELASRLELALAELVAFPLLSYHAGRQPGLSQQMRAILQRPTASPTIAGEACILNGYLTCIAAGMGVGAGDAGHIATLCRSDIVAVPLHGDERITTFLLHKDRRFGLSDALRRFVAHIKTLHQ
ncbi:MAG: LysR family substrate-binding domain-containing protein [Burkholderiaceae bacterium]|nr:LysR family substrate-binding domain-containing protein [Burkholderiaceae bacterium]